MLSSFSLTAVGHPVGLVHQHAGELVLLDTHSAQMRGGEERNREIEKATSRKERGG